MGSVKQWEQRVSALVGKKFNNWTVIDLQYKQKGINPKTNRSTGRLIHVKCDCGFETYSDIGRIVNKTSKKCRTCTSTSSLQLFNNIPVPYFTRLKKEANKRNLAFNITIEDLYLQWEKQFGICALSGIILQFSPGSVFGKKNRKDSEEAQTASLDRIDSSKGYEVDNIQWIHKVVNQMKSNRTDQQFIDWCKLIVQHNKKI